MADLATDTIQQTETTATPKTFTQDEVNRIVQDRLARHKPDGYEDLKEIADLLEDFDFRGTPAEKKQALRDAREARKSAEQADTYKEAVQSYQGVDELPSDAVIKSMAKKWGKDPAIVERALLRQIEALDEADRKEAAAISWATQVKDFEGKFPDVDLEKLSDNKKFLKFVKGKQLPLSLLYEDFRDFVGETDAELDTLRKTVAAQQANAKGAEKSTGSAKGETPTGDYISHDVFEKHKRDPEWVQANFEKIVKSRPKWSG